MGDTERWVVIAELEGGLHIERKDRHPTISGTTALTHYAIIEQEGITIRLYLGLEISTDTDGLCVAYQEMEAFVRVLAVKKQVAITVKGLRLTHNPEEWPNNIGFLSARDFPQCSQGWQPVDHYKDPKNRIRFPGSAFRGASTREGDTTPYWANVLEESHQGFVSHDEYQQALVKDYLAGQDNEFTNKALAMLYFFKVLERIGKKEYANPPKGTINATSLDAIIAELDADMNLTTEDKQHLKAINRWRNTKSEAHLVTEGLPSVEELALCRRVAWFAILRRV